MIMKDQILHLYHAGKDRIPKPDIQIGRKNADFGQGFYLSPDKEFSLRWAGRDTYINEYELHTDGLTIQNWDRDQDWFRYIFGNRRAKDTCRADLVVGPIANDTLYDTLGILTSGLLSDEEALKLLEIGPCYIQVAIKSQKAVQNLKWIGAEHFTEFGHYRRLRAEEERRFQAEFARGLHSLSSAEKIEDLLS